MSSFSTFINVDSGTICKSLLPSITYCISDLIFSFNVLEYLSSNTREDESYKNKKSIYLLEAFSEHLCNDKYVKLCFIYFKYGLFQNLEWITKKLYNPFRTCSFNRI